MQRRHFLKSATALGTSLILTPNLRLHSEETTPAPPPDPAVKRVLVMFKCHFDAGFIDTQANVVHKYFNQYFPQAIETAAKANAAGKRRYTWTTGSWLLYEYLEQASPADRKVMEQAIARGDIAWHALPFTWQTEMLDRSMIEGALAISQSLDKRYGRTTTGAKMSDVPGHTRALVPALAKHGIKFLDIGVNDASTPARLPPIFLWQDVKTKPAIPSSIPVMYHPGYGGVTRVPGSDLAIAIVVGNDNAGPHTAEEIAQTYAGLAHRFPNAEIAAASLTDIANAVDPHRAALPVVTGEIGDTWIYGVASDPLKVARYRELARLRESWIAKTQLQAGDSTDLALLRHLLLEVEHTWGTDTKTWLDFDNYKPDDLARMIDTRNYKVVQFSWAEKRQDLLDAIATLPQPLQGEAQKAVEALKPKPPLPTASAIPHIPKGPIETAHFVLDFDPDTAAIIQLRNKATGREWAGKANPLALFSYQTLSQKDYDRFFANYIVSKADWAAKDFGKPNIQKFGAQSQEWHPKLSDLLLEDLPDGHRILATLRIDDDGASQSGRAAFPKEMYLELTLPEREPVVYLNFYSFKKSATRMPESMWLTFNPIAPNPKGWTLDKSGEPISPAEVVTSGNRHMHALGKGFTYKEGTNKFAVETIDAPVVALGERTPIGFNNTPPDLSQGVHSNLYNNAWGTNYLMWFGKDMRFRYVLRP